MNKSALILLVNGFEEIEAISPIDLLRRAGVTCTVASIEDSTLVTGRDGITLQADILLNSILEQNFDALILPGGPGHERMRKDKRVIDLVKKHVAQGRITGAICAAPTILYEAGTLEDKKYTSHPSVMDELADAITDQAVVIDGEIITSRGAGTATAFALALVSRLTGSDKAKEIADSICYDSQEGLALR